MQRTGTGELAVVIGAGFCGLAAAVRLRARGFRVLVVDALARAGGRARGFERNGFRFDAGPTVLPHEPLRDVFARVGRDVREYLHLTALEPAYRCAFDDGTSFDVCTDRDRLLAAVAALSPRDVEGVRRLAAHVDRIRARSGAAREDRWSLPSLAWHALHAAGRGERSVHALVARYVADRRLRLAFTTPLVFRGGHPFRTPALASTVDWLLPPASPVYARGGDAAVVGALLALLHELGVEVRLKTAVEEIRIRDGRAIGVRTADGRFLPCSMVVSSADATYVYRRLIAPGQESAQRRWRRMRASPSLVIAAIGTSRAYPALAHATIVTGSADRDALDDVFRRRGPPSRPPLFLQAPARTDASLAPAGRDVLHLSAVVPANRSGLDWSTLGASYMDDMLARLEADLLPDVRASIVTQRTFTPEDFENELRCADGSAFGPEPTLLQLTRRRFEQRTADIDRLYIAGMATRPGGGLAGAFASAQTLERLVPPPAEPLALPHLRVLRDRRA